MNPTLLLIEDNEKNRYLATFLLEEYGYEAFHAPDGPRGIALAETLLPEIIVLDIQLPGMDGHWKADARLKAIPFIVYTATYIDPQDERLALDLGADTFILKPSDPEHLIAQLREVQANAATAKPVPPRLAAEDEGAQLKLYNDALIRKLEEKTLQLEAANRALQRDITEREKAELAQRRMAETQVAILMPSPPTSRWWMRRA